MWATSGFMSSYFKNKPPPTKTEQLLLGEQETRNRTDLSVCADFFLQCYLSESSFINLVCKDKPKATLKTSLKHLGFFVWFNFFGLIFPRLSKKWNK